jgi:hypothetical protein
MQCETARIVAPISDENPLGYIVINADDFAEGQELWAEPAAAKKTKD